VILLVEIGSQDLSGVPIFKVILAKQIYSC